MTSGCIHSCSHCLVAQIFQHMMERFFAISSLPLLSTLQGHCHSRGISSLQALNCLLYLFKQELQVLWISTDFMVVLGNVQICHQQEDVKLSAALHLAVLNSFAIREQVAISVFDHRHFLLALDSKGLEQVVYLLVVTPSSISLHHLFDPGCPLCLSVSRGFPLSKQWLPRGFSVFPSSGMNSGHKTQQLSCDPGLFLSFGCPRIFSAWVDLTFGIGTITIVKHSSWQD